MAPGWLVESEYTRDIAAVELNILVRSWECLQQQGYSRMPQMGLLQQPTLTPPVLRLEPETRHLAFF